MAQMIKEFKVLLAELHVSPKRIRNVGDCIRVQNSNNTYAILELSRVNKQFRLEILENHGLIPQDEQIIASAKQWALDHEFTDRGEDVFVRPDNDLERDFYIFIRDLGVPDNLIASENGWVQVRDKFHRKLVSFVAYGQGATLVLSSNKKWLEESGMSEVFEELYDWALSKGGRASDATATRELHFFIHPQKTLTSKLLKCAESYADAPMADTRKMVQELKTTLGDKTLKTEEAPVAIVLYRGRDYHKDEKRILRITFQGFAAKLSDPLTYHYEVHVEPNLTPSDREAIEDWLAVHNFKMVFRDLGGRERWENTPKPAGSFKPVLGRLTNADQTPELNKVPLDDFAEYARGLGIKDSQMKIDDKQVFIRSEEDNMIAALTHRLWSYTLCIGRGPGDQELKADFLDWGYAMGGKVLEGDKHSTIVFFDRYPFTPEQEAKGKTRMQAKLLKRATKDQYLSELKDLLQTLGIDWDAPVPGLTSNITNIGTTYMVFLSPNSYLLTFDASLNSISLPKNFKGSAEQYDVILDWMTANGYRESYTSGGDVYYRGQWE
jgi:hypothetical protein